MLNHFSADTPKPFHSSGYARVSRGDTIGSAVQQTFGERVHMERNRQAVARYGNSMMGQGYIHRDITPRSGGYDRARGAQQAGRPTGVPPRGTFREPPVRHNPFQ